MDPIDKVIQKLPDYFIPQNAKGVDTKVQLQISGDDDTYWLVTIKDQRCKVEKRNDPNARMKVTARSNVLLNILNGTQDITSAYMKGDITFEGNILQAIKFLDFFNLPNDLSSKLPI